MGGGVLEWDLAGEVDLGLGEGGGAGALDCHAGLQ